MKPTFCTVESDCYFDWSVLIDFFPLQHTQNYNVTFAVTCTGIAQGVPYIATITDTDLL
jgi:hypothetical protein